MQKKMGHVDVQKQIIRQIQKENVNCVQFLAAHHAKLILQTNALNVMIVQQELSMDSANVK